MWGQNGSVNINLVVVRVIYKGYNLVLLWAEKKPYYIWRGWIIITWKIIMVTGGGRRM